MGSIPCSKLALGLRTRENTSGIGRVFPCKNYAKGLSRPDYVLSQRHQAIYMDRRRRCLPTTSDLRCSQEDSSHSQQDNDVLIPGTIFCN